MKAATKAPTRCSSSTAFTYILGRAVLGQKKANGGGYAQVHNDADEGVQIETAKKILDIEPNGPGISSQFL